jgi:integrase
MVRGTGTILKKCECSSKTRCPHGWTLRYWVNGKQREKTFKDTIGPDKRPQYGSGKKLAQDFQVKLAHDKRTGDVTYADGKSGDVPFIAYAEKWIAGRRTEGTRANYRLALAKVRDALAGKTLRQVANDRELAQELIDNAPGTYARRVRVVLVSPCSEAVKAGRIASHRLRGLRVEDAGPERAEFTFATKTQLETMAADLEEYGLLIWLGRFAGLRIGESLGVNIADFRESGTVLRLTRQRMADKTFGPLKQRKENEYRDIPVPAFLWAKVQAAPKDADGYLFPAEWRTSVMDRFRKARDNADLPEDFVSHWLRHMFASVLLGQGVPISDVSRFLGHKNINITFATYGHLVPSAFGRARDALESEWEAEAA